MCFVCLLWSHTEKKLKKLIGKNQMELQDKLEKEKNQSHVLQ